jgi:hypothetical protein
LTICDTDSRALGSTQVNAQSNGVTITQALHSITAEQLNQEIEHNHRPCVIIDCEGAELEILDPALAPNLDYATILVETHDCIREGIANTLVDRFRDTHSIQWIRAQGKNPWQFEFLDKLSDMDKMSIVLEGRPETAVWLWMKPGAAR